MSRPMLRAAWTCTAWLPVRVAGVSAVVLAISAVLPLGTASAQETTALAGRIVDETGEPVFAALVRLLGSGDSTVAQRLTDASGEFRLQVQQPGTYRLAVEVLGGRPWISEPFELLAGPNGPLDFVVPPSAIPLDAISVGVTQGCRTPPADGPRIVELYNRLQAAAAMLSRSESLLAPFRVQRIIQSVRYTARGPQDDRGVALGWRHTDTSEVSLRRLFSAPPIDELGNGGYIVPDPSVLRDHWFVVPTPQIIATPEFLANHCFGVDTDAGGSRIGLTFAPRDGVQAIDVQGVLWFEPDSMRLHRLDYHYTRIDDFIREWIVPDVVAGWRRYRPELLISYGTFRYARPSLFGGFVDYDSPNAGCLIPRRWEVRRPRGHGTGWFRPGGVYDMNVEVLAISANYQVLATARDRPCEAA